LEAFQILAKSKRREKCTQTLPLNPVASNPGPVAKTSNALLSIQINTKNKRGNVTNPPIEDYMTH
jgi:hypothetical protein